VNSSYDVRLRKIRVVLPNGKTLFSFPEISIPYGTHVLVQGESGKGKTTLLHLIAGLFSPDDGDVFIGESDLGLLSDDKRCEIRQEKIGVIFQKLNLIDHLTVGENVSLSVPSTANDSEARISHAISRVNLTGRENDICSYLSVGEQQRVAVARVLAQAPEIILADEPTSSLDDKNSRFVLGALKEAARGKTLIVVSHDHRIADQFQEVIPFEEYTK